MIAKMAKYDFVLYAAQSGDFIERLRELGLVDITTTGWEPSENDRQLIQAIEGHAKALEFLGTFRQDAGYDPKAAPFATGEEAYVHYAAAAQQAAALRAEIARLQKTADELRPWGDFSVERLHALSARGIVIRFFSAIRSSYDKQIAEWSEQYNVTPINLSEGTAYFVVVAEPGQEVSLDAQELKAPAMDYREAEEQIAAAEKELRGLNAEFSRVAATEELLADHGARLREQLQGVRVKATAQPAADGILVVMEGWAEKATSDRVDALLEEYPNVIYLKSDPTPEDVTPVKLRNNRFARVFEFVGDMYARPKYGTMDLTPFFAPFYMLFFGICLNDAGYGLVLLLLGLWMLAKNKQPGMMRQAAWFATLCAASTILFGLFSGSFFGMSMSRWFPSIHFFDFQGQFFSWALAIGVLQILFGMLLRVIMITFSVGFRYALGVFGWFVVVLAAALAVGLPMLDPAWVIPFFTSSSPAFYAALGVGAVLMLFFNSPGKNPFVNVGLGLWDTYNNLTGILSDVLSYIRLFAIGLSGGILATVFNDLANGFVPDGANIVVRLLIMIPILLVGHGINIFMSVISSFVHPMRLTFVEFYKNAGFEMSMRSFDPLRKLTKSENR